MSSLDFDVVVVGAGSAGSAAAWHLARAGLTVALLDRRALDGAGASWVNGVRGHLFDRAGIPRPAPPELRSGLMTVVMLDSHGQRQIEVRDAPVWTVDMALLVGRLQRLAVGVGVTPLPRTTFRRFWFDGTRPVALQATTDGPNGSTRWLELRASLFVDATGLAGALRVAVPALRRVCPRPGPADLCAAAQEICKIRDQSGAELFLERHGARPADLALSFMGVEGGFSTLTVRFDEGLEEVELLAGAAADRNRGGVEILRRFVRYQGWIGERISGGANEIPMRRPFDQLATPGLALVGDAGCQTFPSHASGVGTGMIAARLLATSVSHHPEPGSRAATWEYQATFMREVGAVNAAYEVFRRLSQRMSADELGALLGSGLMTPSMARAGMTQQMSQPSVRELGGIAAAAMRNPGLARKLAPAVVRMRLAHAHYLRYPPTPDSAGLHSWSSIGSALLD